VPAQLRDTSYKGADKLGSGKGYKYVHDYPGSYVFQQYMPDDAVGKVFYKPSDQGGEANIRKLRELRRQQGEMNQKNMPGGKE
jgi:putative ATPase